MTEEAITCTRDTTIDILGDAIKDDTIYNVIDDQTTINIFDKIWPRGSLYFGIMETCPLAALFGTWEKVSSGRVLQGADENHLPGTTIEAGLPNVTSGIANVLAWAGDSDFTWTTGSLKSISDGIHGGLSNNAGNWLGSVAANFNANRENSIYGNSDTVQPPAFVVNIWKRTA